jgi:hypothetical protein
MRLLRHLGLSLLVLAAPPALRLSAQDSPHGPAPHSTGPITFATSSTAPAGSLVGFVTDDQRHALAGVAVQFGKDPKHSATTDAGGQFEIRNIPGGLAGSVVVSLKGYRTVESATTFPTKGGLLALVRLERVPNHEGA